MARFGPKPKPLNELRAVIINVHLTAEEAMLVKSAAQAANTPYSSFIREATLSKAKEQFGDCDWRRIMAPTALCAPKRRVQGKRRQK